jgi:uncharacterized protein (DUF2267 family)
MDRVNAHRESHFRNVPRGERAPKAKLTQAQVNEIRELLKTQKPKDLAANYHIGLAEIYSIKNGKVWNG